MPNAKELNFHQKPMDVVKNSTIDFLEHERLSGIHQQIDDINLKNDSEINHSETVHQNSKEANANEQRTKKTNANEDEFSVTKESIKQGSYAPQRYKTTCYFQPKQYPVKYSETVIMNIGSSKKRYFECVYHETKMVPHRWTESMITLTPAAVCKSEINIPFKEDCHYISLEHQQPKLLEVTI